jgi:hypothetical protein
MSFHLGLPPPAPPLRPKVPCVRCAGTRFVRAVPRELVAERYVDPNYQQAVPMAVTWPPHPTAQGVDERNGQGMFEVYVCRTCGFVEWYCRDAASIPIGPEHATEEFDV